MTIPTTVSAAWVRPGLLRVQIEKEPYAHITPEEIVSKTCQYFGLTQSELFRKNRRVSIAYPRQLAVYLLRKNTKLTLIEIAEIANFTDHTTVSYTCSKIAGLLTLKHEAKLKKDLLGILNVGSTVGESENN